MATSRELDPIETPLDPDAPQTEPPLSGTVDDDDDVDDERWDENEAPERQLRDTNERRDELRLDEPQEADTDLDEVEEDEDADDADSE
jgi:hypothetical protein